MRWQMMKTMANNENDIKELQEKERIEEYRSFLYMELLALKMPYKEILTLVSEELIINSIRNHWSVEDVAWALIQ